MACRDSATVELTIDDEGNELRLMCEVVPYPERDWLECGVPDFDVRAWNNGVRYAGLLPGEELVAIEKWKAQTGFPSAPDDEDSICMASEQLTLVGW